MHDTVITAVAPGTVTPSGSDHCSVFTPYVRRWSGEGRPETCPAPGTLRVPDGYAASPCRPAARCPASLRTSPAGVSEKAGLKWFSW
ncbi:hypothetical protein [Streptomyces sp. NPDC058678]|uniref:hypothetical protein n=1 Tax=Streptomyces sp. NPDC058678 TaxID=3346595 RepID=UPI00365C10A7